MGHSTAEPVKIKSQAEGRIQHLAPSWGDVEVSLLRFGEQSLSYEVANDLLQKVGITIRTFCQVSNFDGAGLDMLDNSERHDDVEAPRRAEIAECPKIDLLFLAHYFPLRYLDCIPGTAIRHAMALTIEVVDNLVLAESRPQDVGRRKGAM